MPKTRDASVLRRLAQIDLAVYALLALLFELVADRVPSVAGRMIPPRWLFAALFARNFASVLCVLALGLALVPFLGRSLEIARSVRWLVAISGIHLVLLLALATLVPVSAGMEG